MSFLLNTGALLATLLLGYLFYLVLFERGVFYRTSTAVHELSEPQRLRLLSAVLGTPAQRIDSIRVLREGADLYDVQLAAIAAAKRSVHLEAYIYYPGRIADAYLAALCERARSGVKVRVVIDAIGSLRTGRSYFAPLIEAGGHVSRYHPLHLHMLRRWNSRTHRNLLVVDGEVGFIGGAGVADHWCRSTPPPWRDCVLRVTGPIVAGLQAVFAENWLESTGELLLGPDTFSTGKSTGEIIGEASNSHIDLETLGLAVGSRVRVRVLSGGPYSDHGIVRRAGRRRYRVLLEAGVEIFEYSSRMMHAKVLVVDGRWSLLGSTNIDHRSFGLNDEVNLLVSSDTLATQLRGAFEQDLNQSRRFDLDAWHRRSWSERLLATLGRVIERHQ
jgi:cardiolipin synthase A/B